MIRASLLLSLCLSLLIAVIAQPRERTHSSGLTPQGNAQVLLGAELYYENCSVCHGDTGLGYAEAKTAFPEEERRCEQCHRPKNPPQMVMEQMDYNFAFSLGNPPALRGDAAPHSLGNGATLYSYVRSAMPRPFPGTLSEKEALAITAFLLEANGKPVGGVLTLETAAEYTIP